MAIILKLFFIEIQWFIYQFCTYLDANLQSSSDRVSGVEHVFLGR